MKQGFPDWKKLLGQEAKLYGQCLKGFQTNKAQKRILIATSIGGDAPSSAIESLLAVALVLRDARAEVMLCDEALPACIRGNINNYPNPDEYARMGPKAKYCVDCFNSAFECFTSAHIPVHRYGSFISPSNIAHAKKMVSATDFDHLEDLKVDGMAVGEHALAGALRFYARGTLDGEPAKEKILSRFLEAALLTTVAFEKLLDSNHYDCIVFSHGIYVPLGLIGEVARKRKIPVVNWVTAYRKQRFIFSHGDTYHHTLLAEPVSNWKDLPWSEELDRNISSYLESRRTGARDWIWFHEKPEEDVRKLIKQIGIDVTKPVIGLLTNVIWDAQLHYKANAFQNMLDWLFQTIDYFQRRSDIQLLIRIHPAEIRGTIKSRQLVAEEIEKKFHTLSSNIIIIKPESPVSTYSLMEMCDSVIVYGTKTGVELAARGIPVIVGGEAWIRNKGLTMDAETPKEYFQLLDKLPLNNKFSPETALLAKKYAYHFFYRRMIPLGMVVPNKGKGSPFEIVLRSGIQDLMPGNSVGLDVICDGILNRTEFIYPAEKGQEKELSD